MKNKKILLVGGCGFIGHNLALSFKRNGAQPIILDSLSVNNLYSLVDDEVKNKSLYKSILKNRIDLLKKNEIKLIIQDARDYHEISKIYSEINPNNMTQNQLLYQGKVYRPLDPQAESWDDNRLNLREAFDLDRSSGSDTQFQKATDKYGERLNALDALYGLANSGLSLLGDIVPAATDNFGLAQAVKGVVVSANQQINEMSNLLLGENDVADLAKSRGISVNKLKEQNAAATERMRDIFADPNKLNGVVDSNGQEFNWDRFGRLSDDKAKDAQYKSILLQMAYQAAMVNGQEGRSLSDKDIANMLNIVGGEVSDVNGAIRLMSSFVLSTSANLETRGKRLRENYGQGIDRKPYTIEEVNTSFKDPFASLESDKPKTLRSVISIISQTHPDLLEKQLLDSAFDYKSFINPNINTDPSDGTPPPSQDDIDDAFTNLIMGFKTDD